MPNLNALFITPAATRWLQATRTAHILNVFDRACNLVNQDNDVLALVTSERGLTPFGLVIAETEPSPFQLLVEDSPVSVVGSRLSIGDLSVDTQLASPWSPAPEWAAIRALFATRPERLEQLDTYTLGLSKWGSLLDIFFPFSADAVFNLMYHERRRIENGIVEFIRGLSDNDEKQYLNGARLLAGAGAGLTPAGDDFIVGTVLALWAGLYGPGRESLAQSIVEVAAPLTTTLSGAYLRAAARGECTIHWHRLFTALQGSDAEEMRAAIKSLLSIGHTSGADGLAGFLAARLFNNQ